MGIYIFSWPVLKEALIKLKDQSNCDFGKHIIPYCHEEGRRIFAYEFNGYWKDVGTLGSYWQANMELVDLIPEFNLYHIEKAIIGAGDQIYGTVQNSVLGAGVVVEPGAVVKDSILMKNVHIGKNCYIEKSILADGSSVGDNTRIGVGEEAESKLNPKVYAFGLATIGSNTLIPANVTIGKNTALHGATDEGDYPDGKLESGGYIIKAGESS